MKERWTLAGVFMVMAIFGLASGGEAVFIDEQETLQFLAKAQTRASIRLNDASGFTFPETEAGDLVQHRNLLYLEVNHDLKSLMGRLSLLKPLESAGIELKYRLVGRFMYEGVYDYGPEKFQDVADASPDNFDDFKQEYDLWEAYADITKGPVYFRIGRQNLSWGETDVFRLLDQINPLDSTFGGVFEDLDDRRIPLWMLRGSYNLGTFGPVASVTLESFWVPGFWDARVAPMSPRGAPYAPPQAPPSISSKVKTPGKKLDNSRWGARIMGVIGDNLNLSVGHYKTYPDVPSGRLIVNPANPLDFRQEITFEDEQITGAALNFWETHTETVVRSEVAMFWDEAVFIPQINAPLIPTGIPGLELPATGRIPEKNILRYMVGLDKNFWIRPLNKKNVFFFSMQYFGQYIMDYDERIKMAIPIYPDTMDFAGVKELENQITFLVNSTYLQGNLYPSFSAA
ncbi:MAG: DUF1302 family protein, partial [bacterium]